MIMPTEIMVIEESNPMGKISVVIPVYNEVQTIAELYTRLESVLSDLARWHEIIFVNDASTDSSLEALKKIQDRTSNISVIDLARHDGQTAAIAAGIDAAQGDIIVTMDGDLQHRPEDIPRFLKELDKGYDVVSGCRQKRGDHLFGRRIPSLLANWLMRSLSGIAVKDFGSSYKAYRSEILKRVELFGGLHRFIPVLAAHLGARIKEIPITVHPREKGKSKYGLSRSLGVFQDIIFLKFYLNYITKPIQAFGRLFLLFFGGGILISTVMMFLWLIGVIDALWDHGALLLFSVFLMIVGVQFLATGVLAELLSRIYLHTSHSKIYSVRHIYKSGLNTTETGQNTLLSR